MMSDEVRRLTEGELLMDRPDPPKTVVLALGNLIRSDDSVALHALALLEQDPRVPGHVSFVEGGTKGLELVPYISEAAYLLVLDAVDVGASPGTIYRITAKELRTLPGSSNVHELALADILNALRLMGQEPGETVLLGVQPSTTELGITLSEPAERAVPALVRAAIAELHRWDSFGAALSREAKEPLVDIA